jgi:hypothetical protein
MMRSILDYCGYKGQKVSDKDLYGYFFYKMWFTLRPSQVRALSSGARVNLPEPKKALIAIKDIQLTHAVRMWDPFDFRVRKRLKTLKSIPIVGNEISQEFLNQHVPSVDNIRVVFFAGRYYVSDGNSRVKCLKIVHPEKLVEVDLIQLGE